MCMVNQVLWRQTEQMLPMLAASTLIDKYFWIFRIRDGVQNVKLRFEAYKQKLKKQ